DGGIAIDGKDVIPHDLWRAADLPQLSWVDRLTLVLAQFDKTFRIESSGTRVQIVPAPKKVSLVRTYQAGKQAKAVAKRWATALPKAQVTVEGESVRVAGTAEDHHFVEHRLRGAPTRKTTITQGQEVYQLKVNEAALSQIAAQLAERLHLQFEWDN